MAATPHDLSALVSLLKESAELAAPAGSGGGDATSAGPVRPQERAQTASVVRFGGLGAAAAPLPGAPAAAAPAGFDAQSIWAPEEVLTVHEALAAPNPADARRRPEFVFGYKQRVGSEDVFLGLAGTTESSAHCDTLVMRIQLPGERLGDIDLDCTEDRIVVSAAQQCVGGGGGGGVCEAALMLRALGLLRPARARCFLRQPSLHPCAPPCCLLCAPLPLTHPRPKRPRCTAPSLPPTAQQAGHLSPQQGISQERSGQVGRSALCAAHFLPAGQVRQPDGRGQRRRALGALFFIRLAVGLSRLVLLLNSLSHLSPPPAAASCRLTSWRPPAPC